MYIHMCMNFCVCNVLTFICVCVCVCVRMRVCLCLTNCTEHQNVIRLDCVLKVQRHLQIPFSHSFRVLFETNDTARGEGVGNSEQDCLIKRGWVRNIPATHSVRS